MPTLPEEEEDSPDSSSSSPTSYTPAQSKLVKVAMATPSIVLPLMAASVQPNPRPVEQARPHSPRPRLSRNSASLGVPITTVDPEGHVIDLLKDELPDLQLNDAERQRNLQLLEEAKRVSERFLTRRGRRSTCSLSDSPTALSPSPTPGSSPVPSRSSSTTAPPPPDRSEPNLSNPPSCQRLEVPPVRDQKDPDTVDPEALRRVEWRPSEKRKVSSGTLSPRHSQTAALKKAASSPADTPEESPSPSPATGVAKPVPRPPTQQAPCTAEIKTMGAFPPLMRAVSWDTVGTLNLRNESQSPAHTEEEEEESISALPFSKGSGYKDFPVPAANVQKMSKLREEHKLMRNHSISKLPDLSENAEQERGPSPHPAPDSAQEEESKEKTDVLPSISDVMLRKLKMHRGLPGCAPPLSEKEVENAFVQLSLAYRNDSYTLETRLKQAERERNLTEENTEKELEEFKGSLKGTSCLWQSMDQRESYQRLLETLAVLQRLAIRLSSRAEMVGAVRQERRMNKATEVMMQYVENLKRTYEKDHAELMEFKKLANQNSNRCYGGSIDTGDDGIPRASRSMSLTMGKAMPRRRVSVAVVPKFNLLNIPGQTPGQSPGQMPGQLPGQMPGQSPGQMPGQSPGQTFGQSPGQTPGLSSGPSSARGLSPALPVLCEATVRTGPPNDSTLHTTPESGKQSEYDAVAPAKSLSVEEIRSELKAKIEEEAYKKGYEEGLKKLKELKELKEEEEEEKTDDTIKETKEGKREKKTEEKTEEKEEKELPGERDEEAHTEKRSSSRFWDLWSVVERSCPKVLWQNRVVWAALTFLLVLLFLVNLLGFPSNSSGALGDASSEKAEAPPTQNKLFGLSVGAKAKQE
ncbi:inositol 1,4,5-triphosphate receptor associated 1 isoform X2 [Clupea harengus]|uniref:Inositol 1,4,5-triphosphate receptor associated 1 isoform X2 n=1 Tax=Clupea harengus TaxID=7950 RepID=A0A8M1K856_CLUHA|nr:inositol 1,4,5-triphosphate receptor associated 1 isoform X2 [Clupea harengus]